MNSPTRAPTRRRALAATIAIVGAAGSTGADDAAPRTDDPAVAAARAHVAAHGPRIVRDLADLTRIPNVTADRDGIEANARAIRARFRERGVDLDIVHLPEEDGDAPPVLVGRLDAPDAPVDAPTFGVYVHYDGQPVDAARWTFGPFEPALTDRPLEDGGARIPLPGDGDPVDPEWRLYGRGTGDDRAPLIALAAALDALDAGGIPRTAHLVFLFEGEEEAGSPHLERYFHLLRDRLRADAWLICDGPVHASRRPQLVYGVRGITQLEITVYGATRTLHSGHYGNWAPNPAHRLARLLASMKDDDGRVLIEGFYDDVAPVEGLARAQATLPDFDDALRAELGLAETEAADAPYLERMLLPSLNVRGMQSATVGETARNIVPSTATATLDVRLPKGCDPTRMLDLVEAHVRRAGYHVVREDPDLATRRAHARIARVVRGGGYRAVRTSMELPIIRRVEALARRAAPAGELVLMPTLGGSLPLWLFEDVLQAPVLVVPIANHDDNQHAPDENLRLANLWYGVELYAALMTP